MIKIDKNKLRKEIKHYILNHSPDQRNEITGRLLNKALIFIDGFIICLESMGELPMREDDIFEAVKEQALSYVFQNLEMRT